MKYLLIAFLVSSLAFQSQAQSRAQLEAEFDSAYAVRIKLEEINGVYIPRDLEDAFAELERLSSPEDLKKFQSAPEEAARTKFHLGLGQWIIINWGFYEGSRLSDYLRTAGLLHPEDMARVILVCFHRHLNHQPLLFEEEVAFYHAQREKERLERENKKEVIQEETHVKKE